ncbi:MAG: arsenate reductase ArsC [Candidatus Methylomirabilales bacterium]
MKVLFVCTGNSARSQMAEAFARHYGKGRVEASSAGLDPKGLHPLTTKVMAEKGIDVSHQESKALTEEMVQEADVIVTVCGHADHHCPALPSGARKVHWPIEDPALVSDRTPEEVLSAFRRARDDLESRIRNFLSMLGRENAGTLAR